MNDMSSVIIPKSDQISADDLIAGPRTITINDVKIVPGEQPVTIGYFGDEGRPWKPCKSMCRILVHAWGPDAKKYIGRSLTIYRDPTVKWGGMDVGGIRVSHLSDISSSLSLALTATRGSKKITTVKPLVIEKVAEKPVEKPKLTPMQWFTAKIATLTTRDGCFALLTDGTRAKEFFDKQSEADQIEIKAMLADRARELMTAPATETPDDVFPGDA